MPSAMLDVVIGGDDLPLVSVVQILRDSLPDISLLISLLRTLDVPSGIVAGIRSQVARNQLTLSDAIYQALSAWLSTRGHEATGGALEEALRQCNLNRCADALKKTIPDLFRSTYLNNFLPVERLGQGGFGEVFKVVSKSDGQFYAVKRIAIPDIERERVRVLREVQALATFNHPNIVGYVHHWIESPPPGWLAENDPLWPDSMSSCGSNISQELLRCSSASKNSDIFGSGPLPLSKHYSESEEGIIEKVEEEEEQSISNNNIDSYLYIQQELCQPHTLRDRIWSRDDLEYPQALKIFHQIANAVEHFHSKNFIHRDLKPSNIFFAEPPNGVAKDDPPVVKVGDFGLVCESVALSGLLAAEDWNSGNTKLSSNVGTSYYISPEQLAKQPYDAKVDIYSLGIIFFEMLFPFGTEMERCSTLEGLRNERLFPQEFVHQFPEDYTVIKDMISHNPNKRPNSSWLSEWVMSKSANFEKLAGNQEDQN